MSSSTIRKATFDGDEPEYQDNRYQDNPVLRGGKKSNLSSDADDKVPQQPPTLLPDPLSKVELDKGGTGFCWFLSNLFVSGLELAQTSLGRTVTREGHILRVSTPECEFLGDLQLHPSVKKPEQSAGQQPLPQGKSPSSSPSSSSSRDGAKPLEFGGAMPGFIDFCINVVWVPHTEQPNPANITGDWHEFTFDRKSGKWCEILDLSRKKASDEFKALHPNHKWKEEKDELPLHLDDVPTLPKTKDDYRSNYKMTWLCHHRGFKPRDTAAPSPSFTADVESQKKLSASMSELGTLPKRRLLDREHVLDVVINIVAQIIAVVSIFEPIVNALTARMDGIEIEQADFNYTLLGTVDLDAIRDERSAFPDTAIVIADAQMGVMLVFTLISVHFIFEKTIRQIWW